MKIHDLINGDPRSDPLNSIIQITEFHHYELCGPINVMNEGGQLLIALRSSILFVELYIFGIHNSIYRAP